MTEQPTTQLKELLEAHGLTCMVKGEWILPDGKMPAICAFWTPSQYGGTLYIHVLINKNTIIKECFAGIGSGEHGLQDALGNFMLNSLHVFLSAFWRTDNDEQTNVETWIINGRSYSAYVGAFGTRASEGVDPTVPQDLLNVIAEAIHNEPLSNSTHWVRTFFGSVKEDRIFEALLDNHNWPLGLQCLKLLPWKKSNGYYSVRNFIILRAVEENAADTQTE